MALEDPRHPGVPLVENATVSYLPSASTLAGRSGNVVPAGNSPAGDRRSAPGKWAGAGEEGRRPAVWSRMA